MYHYGDICVRNHALMNFKTAIFIVAILNVLVFKQNYIYALVDVLIK